MHRGGNAWGIGELIHDATISSGLDWLERLRSKGIDVPAIIYSVGINIETIEKLKPLVVVTILLKGSVLPSEFSRIVEEGASK